MYDSSNNLIRYSDQLDDSFENMPYIYRNVALHLEKEVLGRKASFGREEVESQQKSACIN